MANLISPDAPIEVLLPIGVMPEGAKVCKVGGTKVYRLVDQIRVYDHASGKEIVVSSDKVRYLTNHDGHMAGYPLDHVVKWMTTVREFKGWLDDQVAQWG